MRDKTNTKYYSSRVENYTETNDMNIIQKTISCKIGRKLAIVLYTFSVLLQIPLVIINFILYCRNNSKEKRDFYSLNFVLCGFAFIHSMELAIGNTVIDRYMIPAYFAMIIVIINYLLYFIKCIREGKYGCINNNSSI